MITAYDYPSARLADEAGFPLILVGDSMGHVVLGYDSTIPVTLDDIVRATAAVVRGASSALIVADMPFMTFQTGPRDALLNAGRLLREGGASAVKLEGGRTVAATARALDAAGIAVMGHIGLTPQSVHKLGGYRLQGRSESAAEQLTEDAIALEDAGAFAIVLELVPDELAAAITERLSVPTIGIGAGPHCSGQVQVWHDLLGLSLRFTPKHARQYADLAATIRSALAEYVEDVRSGSFLSNGSEPGPETSRPETGGPA
jgi:3-methyl-2-oxobutanoate hydroxymethyltransferase